jgi:hypothetical protein
MMNMKRTLTVIFSAGGAALLYSAIAYARGALPLDAPEPATLALFGAGLAGLAAYRLIRKHKK